MKIKSFISGLLVGAIITSTVSVLGAVNQKIEAWLFDSATLSIGGSDLKLPNDMHILNYQGRIYTPVRFIAENMGAEVFYNADTLRITIATPTPSPTPEPSPEPTPAPAATQTPSPTPTAMPVYQDAPVRLDISNVTVNIYGITRGVERTGVYLDIVNRNSRSATLDYQNAYVEIDGTKYESLYTDNNFWINRIESQTEVKGEVLWFDGVPVDADEMKIVIPMLIEEYKYYEGEVLTSYTYNMNVRFE